MRLSIIVEDGTICKDGVCYMNLDMAFMPADQRAFQWYDTIGEIEYFPVVIDGKRIQPPNQFTNDFTPYDQALVEWQQAHDAALAPIQAAPSTEQPMTNGVQTL